MAVTSCLSYNIIHKYKMCVFYPASLTTMVSERIIKSKLRLLTCVCIKIQEIGHSQSLVKWSLHHSATQTGPCRQHGPKSCRLLRTHSWCLVQRPRYSATNTARILVRFSTVGRCMFSSVSSSVCQNFGKGVLMRCNTGTPWWCEEWGGERSYFQTLATDELWFSLH